MSKGSGRYDGLGTVLLFFPNFRDNTALSHKNVTVQTVLQMSLRQHHLIHGWPQFCLQTRLGDTSAALLGL